MLIGVVLNPVICFSSFLGDGEYSSEFTELQVFLLKPVSLVTLNSSSPRLLFYSSSSAFGSACESTSYVASSLDG